MNNRIVCFVLSILLCSLAFAGCRKSGPEKYGVSGRVTVDGKPMERGRIQFVPDSAKGNQGPIAAAVIENGQYDTSATEQGVAGGAYRVAIKSGVSATPDKPVTGKERKIDYHTTIDLPEESSEQDFEIPASAVQ